MKNWLIFTLILLPIIAQAHNDTGELLCFEYNNVDLDEKFLNDKPMAIFPFVNCSGHKVTIEKIVCNNPSNLNPFIVDFSHQGFREVEPGKKDTIAFKRWPYNNVNAGLYDNSWTIYFKNDTAVQHLNIFIELKENLGVLKVDTVKIETVNRGEVAKFEALVYNTGASAVKISADYYNTSSLRCLTKLPTTIKPGEFSRLQFEIETDNRMNFYQGAIRFGTNGSGKYPGISIPYQGNLISTNHPSIKFDSLVMTAYRNKGESLVYEFWYENNGDQPLIISNCKGSCGCIVPSWSKEPLMPGERDVIKVKYDTYRIGPINKSVTVNTNAGDSGIVLRVKGYVHNPDVPNKI